MEDAKLKIGFIGLGIMGKPMVRNLLNAQFVPTVFNRSRPAIDELCSAGAIDAGSPKEVAEASDIVITMLPDSPDVESVFMGDDGLLSAARQNLLLVDMSTISPVVTKTLATAAGEKGARMLDAPVSGGEKGAIAGSLSIMVGGDEEDFKRAMPVFEAVGKTIVHCGPVGSGQVVKACNQVVVALVIEAVSEALVLGSKAGVEPETILKVLGGGLAQNRVMDLRGSAMIKHDFEPGFKAKLHHKDLKIVLQTARELGVAVPVSALVDQLFSSLVESGKGDFDHSSLLTVIEGLSNHSIATT